MLTAAMIKQIVPNSKPEVVAPMVSFFNMYAEKYAINTYWRIVHFIAQAAHESAHFRTLEEFATGEAYEGRKDLGNIHPGDGKRYKGRGIFQLTGRTNYRNMGKRLGVDLENNPELAETPKISVLTAMEYWNSRGLSGFADRDDVETITRRINGGLNGFEDRKKYLAKAKAVIPHDIRITSSTVTPNVTAPPVVEGIIPANRNSKGENVRKIQKLLNKHGANLKEDGQFGRQTEIAVKAFQKSRALLITGNVDVNTLKALTG
jgi:putative chitinase